MTLNTGHPLSEPSAQRALGLLRFWYAALLGTPLVGERLLRSGGVAKAMSGSWCRACGASSDAHVYLDQFLEPARARAASQVYRSFLLRDIPSVLRGDYRGKRLRQPVLVLHGTDDPVAPDRSGVRPAPARRRLPGGARRGSHPLRRRRGARAGGRAGALAAALRSR